MPSFEDEELPVVATPHHQSQSRPRGAANRVLHLAAALAVVLASAGAHARFVRSRPRTGGDAALMGESGGENGGAAASYAGTTTTNDNEEHAERERRELRKREPMTPPGHASSSSAAEYDLSSALMPPGMSAAPIKDDMGAARKSSLIEMQFPPDEYEGRDKISLVLDGTVSLLDVRVTPKSLNSADRDGYGAVEASFCKIEWGVGRDDPSRVPTFRDLVGASPHCSSHRYSFDLRSIVAAARERDSDSQTSTHSVDPPAGFLFHMGKSGSTALTNALTVATSAPGHMARVIVEHPALTEVLNACDRFSSLYGVHDCDEEKQVDLLRDVVYLLGRSNLDGEENMYLKVPSHATPKMGVVRRAYPNVKWVFVHRDGDEVLAKHTASHIKRPSCAKNANNPSKALQRYVAEQVLGRSPSDSDIYTDEVRTALRNMSKEEVCSAYLATVVRAAIEEHERSGTGMMVDYGSTLKLASEDPSEVIEVLEYLGVENLKGEQDEENEKEGQGKVGSPATLGRIKDQLVRHAHRRHKDQNFRGEEEVVEIAEEVRNANRKHLAKVVGRLTR